MLRLQRVFAYLPTKSNFGKEREKFWFQNFRQSYDLVLMIRLFTHAILKMFRVISALKN